MKIQNYYLSSYALLNKVPKSLPILFGILSVAIILFVTFGSFYYVGLINDDSVYVLLAKALLSGHYISLYQPGFPPHTIYPPGFPILLAPFVAILKSHVQLLKGVGILFTTLDIILFWILLRSWFPVQILTVVVTLFALHPTTIAISSTVLSEPSFLFFILLAFLVMKYILLHPRATWGPWVLGLLLGYIVLIRSIGIVVTIAVLAVLITQMSRKKWILIASISLILGGSFYLRNRLINEGFSGYSTGWLIAIKDINLPLLFNNLNGVLDAILVNGLFAYEASLTPLLFLFRVGLRLLAVGIIIQGSLHIWQHRPENRPMMMVSLLLIGSWLGIFTVWNSDHPRYFWPILPLTLSLFVAGLQKTFTRWRGASWLACLMLLATYVAMDAKQFSSYAKEYREPIERMPTSTWAWIQTHIPEHAIFIYPKPSEIYLYTNRQAFGWAISPNPDHYRNQILTHRATHVLLRSFPMHDEQIQANQHWLLNQVWTANAPEAFRKIYQNTVEGSSIYEVVNDPKFMQAYSLYEAGRHDILSGHRLAGFRKLDQSLKLSPRLAVAYRTYGSALLMNQENLPLAIERLHKAAAIDPTYTPGWLDLAHAYGQKGNKKQALKALQKAYASTEEPSLFKSLRPQIEKEGKALFDDIHRQPIPST